MEAVGKQWITYPSRSDQISIWNLSDWHLGERGCNLSRLKEDIERIRADDHSFWLGGGDYASYISPHDKRWDASTLDPNVFDDVKKLGSIGHTLAKAVVKLAKPIAHKCVGMLLGNHEDRYEIAKEQQHLHAWTCTELGVPNLGYLAIFDIGFNRVAGCRIKLVRSLSALPKGDRQNSFTLRVVAHHGFSSAATPGGKLNSLLRAQNIFDADLFFMGHVHDQLGKRTPVIGADDSCTKLVSKDKIGVISGSYLMTYAQGVSGYGERRGYAPTVCGAVRAIVTPDKKEVRGEI